MPIQGDLQGRVVLVFLQDTPSILELIGQEQELAPCESPDIEFAEVLELAIHLLLADLRPPPDSEDEDGGPDTGVIWTRKILENRENRRGFPPFLLTCFANPERETRQGCIWGWGGVGGVGGSVGRREQIHVGFGGKTTKNNNFSGA